jgi:hypothetical protein
MVVVGESKTYNSVVSLAVLEKVVAALEGTASKELVVELSVEWPFARMTSLTPWARKQMGSGSRRKAAACMLGHERSLLDQADRSVLVRVPIHRRAWTHRLDFSADGTQGGRPVHRRKR